MLIKANINDFDAVMQIYNEVLSVSDNCRYSNWEAGLYPTDETARDALENGTLYFYFEDKILKGTVILDTNFPEEYQRIPWKFIVPSRQVLTLHTLCIRPKYVKRGSGSKLLADIEKLAREKGYRALRFDTHNDNVPAQRMYKKNGYHEAGIAYVNVYGKLRLLNCYEKQL